MHEGQTVHFDGWTLHRPVGELAREGRRIRLQDQPFQVLDELLAHPGELVTREQLIARLWPKVVVDFDTGLNSAVRKLRVALGDVAETPRYIETVPRRGYRFIGTIDPPAVAVASQPPRVNQGADVPSPEPVAADPVLPSLDGPQGRPAASSRRRLLVFAALGIAVVVAALLIELPRTASGLRPEPSVPVAPQRDATPAVLAARTLAVLPFHASSTDETAILLALSVTDLVRNRLAALEDLTVVASSSTSALADSRASLRSIGEKLRAQVLLTGTADRRGERLRVAVQLVDARSGERLWSEAFDRPVAELVPVREQIFRQVAGALGVPVAAAADTTTEPDSISLDAYLLYMRGQRLLASSTVTDAREAVELFRRATILEPGFARAYLGLGQALKASGDKTLPSGIGAGGAVVKRQQTSRIDAQAADAIERALELNPALGEAWIERARLTPDPVEAEELYRKGLGLTPNYADGYAHFANFLFGQSRVGEAIETVTRASEIDPLTPGLYQLHAFLLMVARSDIAGHDRLVREALAINPRLPSALRQLAQSRWEYSGEFADAAQLIEQAIAADPHWEPARRLARDIYLDLGDRAAAGAVIGDVLPADARMEIAQYDGDGARAAALLGDIRVASTRDISGSFSPEAEAIRDGAIANRSLGPGLEMLESVYGAMESWPRMWSRGFALVYAHTLVLAGDVERGRQLAESILKLVETHGVGRSENWFSRERAAAFAVLRDDGRALDELEISVRTGKLYRWWYLAGHDPLYAHLRDTPRFQATDGEARRHLERQRAQLEELRRQGVVPRRPDPG
jgi:TolB-like protein/DNA-binding winged helix-turn-helix (wHTH) protein/Tfp pilus assembly protein PilF